MSTKISLTKTIFSSFVIPVLFLQLAVFPVFAEDLGVGGLIKDVNTYQNQATKAASQQQKRLSEIISHADTYIANRITSLNTLNTRIQNDTQLTQSQKTALSSQIQTTITGLTTLKTKIDADTTTQTALADGKQIFTTYRVYEVLEPQIRLLIILNNIQASITKVQALTPQLQNLITSLQSQGKDVSQLTPLLADVNSQLQTISTTINNDITTVQNVTPATTNPQTIFQTVRNDIQNIIKTDFQKIRTDVSQMRAIFRQIIIPSVHPDNQKVSSETAVPSITTTPKEQ